LLSSTLIHDIEMVLSTNTAPAERVHAEAVIRKCAQWGSHDAVVATMRFEDGAVAMFESSWVMPPTAPDGLDPAFHLIGDGGSIIIEGSSQGMRVSSETGYTHTGRSCRTASAALWRGRSTCLSSACATDSRHWSALPRRAGPKPRSPRSNGRSAKDAACR
jgi:predicted dehydrogenase